MRESASPESLCSGMKFRAFATDYDGTLATAGTVDAETLEALQRLRASGRILVLVTGRELDELIKVFPGWGIFHRIVAENGALLFDPRSGATQELGTAPPPEFVESLRRKRVEPISVGRVIVATREPHAAAVHQTIQELKLPLKVHLNKRAIMVLPPAVDKGTGLVTALEEFQLEPQDTLGVGDAENDLSFLNLCGFSVAVANALPEIKRMCNWTSTRERGAGVRELIQKLDLIELFP